MTSMVRRDTLVEQTGLSGLTMAAIALIAVGLVVVLARPGGPTAGPSPAPSSVSTPSVAPQPSTSISVPFDWCVATARSSVLTGTGSTEFICSPLEQAPLPEKHFDVIWGDNVLHHVLPVLDESLRLLARVAKPGAKMLFIEPVNLCPALRKLRFLVPVHTEVTPGERPLEKHDLEIVGRHVSELRRRHFGFLGRLVRFILSDSNLEQASFARRAFATSIAAFDALVLSVPKIETLGGMSVLYGRAAAARA